MNILGIRGYERIGNTEITASHGSNYQKAQQQLVWSHTTLARLGKDTPAF